MSTTVKDSVTIIYEAEGMTQADALANLDVRLRKHGVINLARCEVKNAVRDGDMWTITLIVPVAGRIVE